MQENLKTDTALLKALERAATYKPTADDVERQRLSFVMGSLKSTNDITRAEVKQILNQHEGRAA
jgi:hypothetical protein